MSSYTEGQTHQLMDALEKAGFTPTDITTMGQLGKRRLTEIRLALNEPEAIEVRLKLSEVEKLLATRLVRIPAIKRFVIEDYLSRLNPPIEVVWYNECFVNKFVEVAKVRRSAEQKLSYVDLPGTPSKGQIINNLGKRKNIETSLFSVYYLMSLQPTGKEEGCLLTSGETNIFYVENHIIGIWYDDGWNINAYALTQPITHSVGCRVFSLYS